MKSPIEEKLARVLEPMLAAFEGAWKIESQVRFGRYTVDFLVSFDDAGRDEIRIAVECDGHTYHDRTDEQATHDRKRDRWLLREGIVTVRFSSTEIFGNAEACATELIRTVSAIITQRRSQRDGAWGRGFMRCLDEAAPLLSEPEEHW